MVALATMRRRALLSGLLVGGLVALTGAFAASPILEIPLDPDEDSGEGEGEDQQTPPPPSSTEPPPAAPPLTPDDDDEEKPPTEPA